MDKQQPKRAQKAKNGFSKGAIIGGLIGLAVGGTGGYFVARKQLLKKCREDVKKAYKRGYSKGEAEAESAAHEVIDEITKNTIVVDGNSPEDIQKALKEHADKIEQRVVELWKQGDKNIHEIAKEVGLPESVTRQICFANGPEEPKKATVEVIEDHAKAAEVLNDAYEKALGVPQNPDDIDDWDLSVDDEEAYKRSEERARYFDMIDKYQQHPEDGPMFITRKQFEEECYLQKDWVTYYAGDNVFASDQDADSKMDAVSNFGVTNGNDLFDRGRSRINDEDNDDDNIVYIRNFKMNTVYEITRTNESHARMMSGEVYLDGEPDPATGSSGG